MDKKGTIKLIFIFSMIIASLFLVKLVVATWSGSGNSSDPYQITNCIQLQNMSANLTAYFKLMNDINCSNTSSWNAGAGFNPIGAAFLGELSGQNYTISSLVINRGGTNNIGLFVRLNGGNVSDLGLIDVNISGTNWVGALAGRTQSNSLIDHVYATGIVNGSGNVGGLVGLNRQSIINNSNSSVVVNATNSRVGGLVGENYDSATIDNSYATGDITGNLYVGGLVGYNYYYATIDNSYATGDVTGSADRVGGLVGQNYKYSIIDNSYATGTVNGANKVGGLVGYNYYDSNVDNSYAIGNVNGGSEVGGLVGENNPSNYANINNSFATGNVTGTTNVGGLVGANYDIVANSFWYNNSGDNANNCVGRDTRAGFAAADCAGTAGGSVGLASTINYFFNVSNILLVNWSYPPWSNFCDLNGYPPLNWQGISNVANCLSYSGAAPDTTSPASVINLSSTVVNTTNINWSWTNPGDTDFNSSIIYLDGVNVQNTSNNYYNGTGLTCNTSYNLTIHTKDHTGNVNTTDVTNINTTASCPPDITAPTWSPLPSDQVVNYSQPFGYDVNATDNVAVDSYSINDTTNFAINATGYITNNTLLSVGAYSLNITVNDTSGNENSTLITITVKLTEILNITANTSTNIDLSNADANITLFLANNVTANIVVTKETPNASGTTASLNSLKGIDITVDSSTEENLTWALIKIYYNLSELTAANIEESSLKIYYYNETAGDWQLEQNQGLDTVNDYVWVNITHFSLFGAFGSVPSGGGTTTGGGGGSTFTISDIAKERTIYKFSTFRFKTAVSSLDYYQYHNLKINTLSENSVNFTVYSTPKDYNLKSNETAKIDLDDDNVYDLEIILHSIYNDKAKFSFKSIEELVIEDIVKEPNVDEFSEKKEIKEEKPKIEEKNEELKIKEDTIVEKEKNEEEIWNSQIAIIAGIIFLIVIVSLSTYFIFKNIRRI